MASPAEIARQPLILRLRPGLEVLEVSADKLHLAFANHTVTFTTPAVTGVVKALVRRISRDGGGEDLVTAVAQDTGQESGLVAYVLEMLQGAHCLHVSGQEPDDQDDALSEYFASIGENPSAIRKRLETVRPVNLVSESAGDVLSDALADSGMTGAIIP